jgi:ABC-type antimicrobial peptide transport system permease subunit
MTVRDLLVARGFLYTQRMNAELFGIIAVLGLVLSAAGIFGVVTLSVARRRREIGIRAAMGADRRSTVQLVLSTVSAPLAAGVLLGLAGASATARAVEGLLWGVTPTDPLAILSGAAVLLLSVALALAIRLSRWESPTCRGQMCLKHTAP